MNITRDEIVIHRGAAAREDDGDNAVDVDHANDTNDGSEDFFHSSDFDSDSSSDGHGRGGNEYAYNILTKAREVPKEVSKATAALSHIHCIYGQVEKMVNSLDALSSSIIPRQLKAMENMGYSTLNKREQVLKELQQNVQKIRLYWYPETMSQLGTGVYQRVRQDTEELYVKQSDMPVVCSVCQDPHKAIMVRFVRRCTTNPFLKKQCDEQQCTCNFPSLCLECVLEHMLINAIRKRKSSTRCPNCRGEICLYDIQEVIVKVDDRQELTEENEALRQELEQLKRKLLHVASEGTVTKDDRNMEETKKRKTNQ